MLRLFGLVFLWGLLPAVSARSISLRRVPQQQPGRSSVRLNSNVSVSGVHGFAYLARMDIGAQDFEVLLDTGSSDLWVVSSNCTEHDCQNVPKYKPSPTLQLSSTDFALNYLLGAVSGVVGTETVALGPYEIVSQVFALANATMGLGLSSTGNSGILGLSFPVEAAIPDTSGTTLLENLLSPFDDPDRYFAIKLGRGNADADSSFTLGELDPAYANSTAELTYTAVYPVASDVYDYWKIPLQSLTINSTSFALSRSRVHGSSSPIAVFDTGTTLILGPSDDVDRLWQSIGGARKTDSGWQVRCDRAVVIGLVLGESSNTHEYFIDPADLSWLDGGREGDWCLGGVQANDNVASGDWLLGDTFLRNVYIAHHVATGDSPPRIGLKGLTDPTAALQNFRLERGSDRTPPVPVLARVPQSSHGISSGVICGVSAGSGVVLGALLTAGITLCVARRSRKY